MRVEYIGDATLYLGDCLEILPTLDKVDAVITDPPYGIGIADWDSVDYYDFLFEQSKRVTRDGCYSFIFSSKKNLKRPPFSHDIFAVTKNFAQYRQHLGVFDAWYPIIYFANGKPNKYRNPSETKVPKRNWYLLNTANTTRNKDNPKTNNEHVTPKNIKLIEYLVENFSNEGDTILDPFMGSGTTGVACAELNRKFIGIEIEPKYFDIACKRIETAYSQPRLFDDLEDDKSKPIEQELGFEEGV